MLEKYKSHLEKYGIDINKERLKKLEEYALLVHQWNKKINLTAAKNIKEIMERHIIDSLMPLVIGIDEEKEIVDLGSGGGFPAIPLAICQENTLFILVEKVLKKCAFLNRVKRELSLENIKVENSLIEEINKPLPEALITRAVKINKKLISLVKKMGIKTIYTFETSKPEQFLKINEYSLPNENKTRYIVKREVK